MDTSILTDEKGNRTAIAHQKYNKLIEKLKI
jgi:hypothetical protein